MSFGRNILPNAFNFFNQQHPGIKFTMEAASSLPYFDELVTCLSNDHLDYSVYRKFAYTDLYLHANLDHHPE